MRLFLPWSIVTFLLLLFILCPPRHVAAAACCVEEHDATDDEREVEDDDGGEKADVFPCALQGNFAVLKEPEVADDHGDNDERFAEGAATAAWMMRVIHRRLEGRTTALFSSFRE